MSLKKRIRKLFGARKTEPVASNQESESVPAPAPAPALLTDPCAHLYFLRQGPFGAELNAIGEVPRHTINWVVPDFGVGSGGHLNIFRMVANLESLGFDCRVVIDRQTRFSDGVAAKTFIAEHYMPLNGEVYVGEATMPPAWFTFATAWETAYTVRNFRSTHRKCYFVQDFEPMFFPAGTIASLAEQTYRFGFLGITSGNWLADCLGRDYGMRTRTIGFSYDRVRYAPLPRGQSDKAKRIFFYARQFTPRRGFELGILVLSEVAKRMPDVEIVLAGSDVAAFSIPFDYRNAGILALDDLPRLYSDCDVALVLSHTNLSLLPLELMACGCPVVSNRGENVEWLLNGETAMLAENDIDALADAIQALLTNEDLRQRLIRNGLALAHSTDWKAQAALLASYLQEEQGS